MPIEVTTVAHGAAAFDALTAAVRAAKAGDPLRPVAVVVPTNTAGVTARRAIGRRGGAAAVDVLTIYRLAELLGSPALLATGRRPVSTPVVDLAVRRLLARSPGLYHGVAAHPSTIVALRNLYREVRLAGPRAFTRLGRTERGREPARVVGELARALSAEWYDEADLLVAATERVGAELPHRLTRLVLHLPERLRPLDERLVRAIGAASHVQIVAGLTGEPSADEPVTALVERLTGAACPAPAAPVPELAATVDIVSTTDADDEVRLATRAVVDAARRGTRFDRMAVLWPADRPYARLVEHHLTAAGVPWNGRPGAHVSERLVPRLLTELLDLDRRGLRRADLMNLLGEIPARDAEGRPVPAARWERLARRAGIIRDADWDIRLPAYVRDRERDGRNVDGEAAQQIGRFVTELRAVLGGHDERRPWTAWVGWTAALLDHWFGPHFLDGLTGEERAAWEETQQILDRLAHLDTLGDDPVTRAELRATFVAELDVLPPRRGAVGDGVHVGTLGGSAGLDIELAVVLGAREGLLPPIPATDPLLGEAERRAAGLDTPEERIALLHHHLLAAIGPTPRVTITVPRGDLRSAAVHHPSRWIARFGASRDVDSHAQGLATVEFPVSEAEHRARQLWVVARAGGDIRDHRVHHDDEVLRRAVAMLDARAGPGMTAYDGDLSSRPLPPFSGPVSPTAVEQWVKCPHAYFVAHVLGVHAVEEPADIITISPLERGSAIHDAIDRLQQAVLRGDVPAPGPDGWTPEHEALLRQLAEEVADELEARGVAGRAATWASARPLLTSELHRWIDVDRQHWGARRLLLSEQRFGGEGEVPVGIELPDGRQLAFTGAIDRVDELPDGTLLVTDHKTSKVDDLAGVATDPTVGGTRFQLPVYAAAARALLGRPHAPVRAEFAFFSRGRFARHGVTFDDDTWALVRADLAHVVAGIDAGFFPANPEPPGYQVFVDCACCDPDGLGTADRFAEWERTRSDPRLDPWFAANREARPVIDQLRLDLASEGDTPPPPPDHASRRRIADDTEATLFVEAGAGAGKTTALVGRIVHLVDDGVPLDAVAAITFTEKAAAELRHQIRLALDAPAQGERAARRRAALEVIDRAPIGTVHAFARRLLYELPIEAGLPPGFGVLDELESHLELDERWEDLQDQLLDDATRPIAPGLTAAELVQLLAWPPFGRLEGLRRIIEDFQANWDLVEARVDLDSPPRPPDLLGPARIALAELVATPVPDDDSQREVLDEIDAARAALVPGADLGSMLTALDALSLRLAKLGRVGNQAKWRGLGGAEALHALREREIAASALLAGPVREWREYRRLVVGALAGRFVVAGAEDRAAAGTLEFHDLLVLARRLLATSAIARSLLHQRYQRVLLDEFQDTDPIQLEIAVRLTAPPDGQPADALTLRPETGRLFVVGDPKQSIYRFRRADIAVYLSTPGLIGADLERLTANFRSTTAVIDWVNGVFGSAIQPEPNVQPAYHALSTCRPGSRGHGSVTVLGLEEHDATLTADGMRVAEASEVAAAVATALNEAWPVTDRQTSALRPCRPGDITILLPARTSLPMLQAALFELDVPYRAENASVVYVAPEIRAMMLTLRAAADPTDELALVEALRTPLYGCSDVELFDWRAAGGRFRPFAWTPAGMEGHPVHTALEHVSSLARRVGRSGPAELLEAIVDERRVVETALAGPSARDVWRRVRYVVDQARAWTDAGGRGVRRYLRWVLFQGREGRAGDSVLPERDHDAVRIMTVHAAKGLEFPITILAGLTTRMPNRRSMSVVWPPGDWRLVDRHDEQFEDYKPLDEQMGDAERRRLLYVGCTRAVDHLVVSLHRRPEKTDAGTAACTSATVLAVAGAAGHGATARALAPAPIPHRPADALELPWADAGTWAAERARAVAAGSVRSATSATRLAGGPAPGDLTTLVRADPGLGKDPVDLDLPPWQRGRYGTAIGRAVHAVLQDADLATGHDIAPLAAAQCASEGIFDLQPSVEALARSALAAPIVMAAAAGAEHWRELFVVAPLGDAVLEGYIDLLVRTPSGLVVVDYKTDRWASTSSAAVRIGRYRLQLAAYGMALGRLLDEPIAGGVLVHCRVDGPAAEIPIDRWAEAIDAVVQAGVAGDYFG